MPSIFDQFVSEQPGYPLAAELAARQLQPYCRDAGVLDSGTALVVTADPDFFRQLTREWPDRDTAEALAEAVHQLELERAAKPPVIEVTVTTPPGGIARAELGQLVQDTVEKITGPQPVLVETSRAEGYVPGALGPATLDDLPHWQERSRPSRVLAATRKARDRLAGRGAEGNGVPEDAAEQTQMIEAVRVLPGYEPEPYVHEVPLP